MTVIVRFHYTVQLKCSWFQQDGTHIVEYLYLVAALSRAAVDTDPGDDHSRSVDREGHCVRTPVTRVPVSALAGPREPVRSGQKRLARPAKVSLKTFRIPGNAAQTVCCGN